MDECYSNGVGASFCFLMCIAAERRRLSKSAPPYLSDLATYLSGVTQSASSSRHSTHISTPEQKSSRQTQDVPPMHTPCPPPRGHRLHHPKRQEHLHPTLSTRPGLRHRPRPTKAKLLRRACHMRWICRQKLQEGGEMRRRPAR
jgi:hypothetical protein